MTAPTPATARLAFTHRLPRAGLDGGALSVRAWLALAAGTAGGLVFTGVYLAEGATRAGYRALNALAADAALAVITIIWLHRKPAPGSSA